MIDDDERPEPGWLAALVTHLGAHRRGARRRARRARVQRAARPVGRGRPLPHPAQPGHRGARSRRRGRQPAARRRVRCATSASGSTSAVGLAGGEDTLFSRELHAKGASMVWCAESVVVDRVPPDRMTRRWVLKRAMSHGDAAVRVGLRLAPGPLARAAFRVRSRRRRRRPGWSSGPDGRPRAWCCGARSTRPVACGRRCAGSGMVRGAWGLHHVEYARRARVPRCLTGCRPGSSGGRAAAGAPSGSVEAVRTAQPEIVLTFDDGPDPSGRRGRAGRRSRRTARRGHLLRADDPGPAAIPELIAGSRASGHEIGLHGATPRLTDSGCTRSRTGRRPRRPSSRSCSGQPVRWFRRRKARQTPATWLAVRRCGLMPVLWGPTTWDWRDAAQDDRVRQG